MTHPDPSAAPSTPPAEPARRGARKWLVVAGGVVAVGVVAAAAGGVFGAAEPEIGDCVQMESATDLSVVDCDAAEAEYTVVGIDGQELNRSEFDEAEVTDVCTEFADTQVALWIGNDVAEAGTIYCAAAR